MNTIVVIFPKKNFLVVQTVEKKTLDQLRKAILITGGDPAGIAPELFEKAFQQLLARNLAHNHLFIYFHTSDSAHKKRVKTICENYGITCFEFLPLLENSTRSQKGGMIFYELSDVDPVSKRNICLGSPNTASGQLAFAALEQACSFALTYGCTGLVTAPLSKEWVVRSGQKHFRGHTDYLAERCESEVLMLMHGRNFSVVPLTVHIAMKDVSKRIKRILKNRSIITLLQEIKRMPGYDELPWALCGFNPHAGENGLIGHGEEEVLTKWRQELCTAGLSVEGPLPADGLFMQENRAKYRLILGCYHDQVLIPFKSLEGMYGINCTVGLPFSRSSPDHGTAFGLAGKNQARHESMYRALKFVCQNS